ncbi:hypothetical protein ACKS0A_01787 [Histoplasma ohiense]
MVGEKLLPMHHLFRHTLHRGIPLLLAPRLLLLLAHRQLEGVLIVVFDGDVHEFDAANVRCAVLREAASDVSARGVGTGEAVVAAALTVDTRVRGDVEDHAVDGDIDGQGGVGAVVEGELCWCEFQGSAEIGFHNSPAEELGFIAPEHRVGGDIV